jgi:hypothetical protein
MPLITRNVFIDTEFFLKAELDFSSDSIRSFEELCQKSELTHITSTVVVQEVRKKILEYVKEGLRGIENFKKRSGFLRNDEKIVDRVFPDVSEEELKAKGYADFDNFLDATNAHIIDMSDVDGNEILDMFFKQKRPFGAAKKQNEFRDAFSLLSIRSILKPGEKIYVISADPDHKAFCNVNGQFVSIDTLSALLDVYYKHIDKRSEFVDAFLDRKKQEIIQDIKVQLENADGFNSSTWEDAELDRFQVVEIGDFEPEIIHLDDVSCRIVFNVEVKFLVEVMGPDTANGHYDREDGVLYTFESVEREEEEEHSFSIELDLTFESDEGEFINDEFNLNIVDLQRGIEFGVEEFPYEDPRM